MKIPVVFITDENFVMQTGVAIFSLAEHKRPETEYMVYVVMAECSSKARKEILKVERNGIQINIIEASLEMFSDIKQLSHIPISCLLKFNICDYVPDQQKLIYLDGDIYVRDDLTELYMYELGDNILAGVPSLDMLYDNRKLVNAGILLFNAKSMRENKMSEKLIAKRRELGDRGSMDQQTFNLMLSDKTVFLPLKYNCIPNEILGTERNKYPLKKLNELYNVSYLSKKKMVDDAVILHYATGRKPWAYSYVSCADEWYQCYLRSPYGGKKLKRKGVFQVHVEGLIRNIKSGGGKAVCKRAVWYIKNMFGKNQYKEWG